MSAPTIPAQLAHDLTFTLTRLRSARDNGDYDLELVAEGLLNRLLDRIPRKAAQCL